MLEEIKIKKVAELTKKEENEVRGGLCSLPCGCGLCGKLVDDWDFQTSRNPVMPE